MSLLALCSVKAAPGVTTTAVALGAIWPSERRVLVAEVDPSGGDLAPRFALPAEPGLLSLAAALRRNRGEPIVWRHCQRLPGGLAVLTAPAGTGQASSALAAPGVLEALTTVGGDVVADCGRFSAGSPEGAVLRQAALTVLIARPVMAEVEHLAADLPAIANECSRLGLVLVGQGDYPAGEVAAALGLELLGVLPRDPRGAAWLAGAAVKAWALRRAALVRAAWPLARTLATRLPDAAGQAASIAPAVPAQPVPGPVAAPPDSSPLGSPEASS
jgi:hypothetical protein